MNVLLINGSPHEQGCTYTALKTVAEALNACGVESEIVGIGAGPVRGCTGCRGCGKGKSRCVFDDDPVNALIERAEAADGIVIGSPVYYAAPNGALLAVLDRMFYAAGRLFAHKPGAAVVSARRGGTTAAFEVLNKYFTISQMPIVSSRYWNMVHGNTPEQVMEDEEGLQIMSQLGYNMAWLLQCIEAGREKGLETKKIEKPVMTNFIR